MTLSGNDQTILRDTLGRYLAEQYERTRRRASSAATPGFDVPLWSAFAHDLQILGVGIAEAEGGVGGSAEDVAAVLEELGGALAAEPYLGTMVVGAGLLRKSATPQARTLLSRIPEGTVRMALAQGDCCARRTRAGGEIAAVPTSTGYCLSGSVELVYGAPWSSHILVSAITAGCEAPGGSCLIASIDRNVGGLRMREYPIIDGGWAADLDLAQVTVPSSDVLIGPGRAAADALNDVLDQAAVAICAEALGVLRRLCRATVSYLRERTQFGKPLADFQVLRYHVVDMYIELAQSAAATQAAMQQLDAPARLRELAVSAAKWQVSRACRCVAEAAVQLHGAVGTTQELELGDYFKRALVISAQFGSAEFHRRRFQQLTFEGDRQ